LDDVYAEEGGTASTQNDEDVELVTVPRAYAGGSYFCLCRRELFLPLTSSTTSACESRSRRDSKSATLFGAPGTAYVQGRQFRYAIADVRDIVESFAPAFP
jgi:hypothetical protein